MKHTFYTQYTLPIRFLVFLIINKRDEHARIAVLCVCVCVCIFSLVIVWEQKSSMVLGPLFQSLILLLLECSYP